MTSLSFVILAYNDAPSLPRVAAEVLAVLAGLGAPFELVLMDDGSRDDTAAVSSALAAADPRVRTLRHERNQGVGAAFATAVATARYDAVGYIDGDGQYAPADIPRLLAQLGSADVASGMRTRRADPWPRRVVSAGYRQLLGALFGLRLCDTNSGLKLYRRWVLQKALPLTSRGPFFDAEVLLKARAAGARIAELPIEHRAREHGRALGASPHSVLSALADSVSPALAPYRSRGARARLCSGVLAWLCTRAAAPRP